MRKMVVALVLAGLSVGTISPVLAQLPGHVGSTLFDEEDAYQDFNWGYIFGGGRDFSSDGPDAGNPVCGDGTSVECERVSTDVCLEWRTTSGSGGFTVGTTGGGFNVGYGQTCVRHETKTTVRFYKKTAT